MIAQGLAALVMPLPRFNLFALTSARSRNVNCGTALVGLGNFAAEAQYQNALVAAPGSAEDQE